MRTAANLLLLSILFITACNNKPEAADHYFNDYEQAVGWMDAKLEKGVSHSGQYSQRIDPDREYSHGFTLPVTQLASRPEGILKTEVWVTAVTINAPVKFVIDVVAPASNKHFKTVYEDLQPLLSDLKGWKKATASLDLSGLPTNETYVVKVYIWNNQQQQLWMDDLSVQFIKR